MADLIAETLGTDLASRYKFIGEIGRGGMANVYLTATADLPDELVTTGEIRSEGLRDEVGHGQNSPSRVRS